MAGKTKDNPFGRWLKEERQKRGLTRKALAEMFNYSPSLIHKIEAGTRRPTEEFRQLIAKQFQIPLTEVPPASGMFPASRIPAPPTPLIGREAELLQLTQWLSQGQARLITLTGPPGVGKTHLGLEAAQAVSDFFEDGAYFVNLTAVHGREALAHEIARVFGIVIAAGQPAEKRLLDRLQHKHLLLVLDNFEQLAAEAVWIAELLAHAPRWKALVTSRIPLNVRAEQRFPLAPLALPKLNRRRFNLRDLQSPAVRLFVTRVQAFRPDFTLIPQNALDVARVCIALDGLPLAIELAASQCKALSPHEVLAQLDSRLKVLRDNAPDRDPHHRTLRDAITWSYNLLDTHAQKLFAQLAVFVNGFTLEAVQAVSPIPDVVSQLNLLVEHSLVRSQATLTGEIRYDLLETIREFAGEQLEQSGEIEQFRQHHAAYFLNLAQQAQPEFRSPQQAAWLDRLEAEFGNLQAAFSWLKHHDPEKASHLADALWWFWFIRIQGMDGRTWFQEVLKVEAEVSVAMCARMYSRLAFFAWENQQYPEAIRSAEQAVILFREINDNAYIAYPLATLGLIALHQADFPKAEEYFTKSIRLFEAQALPSDLTDVYGLLGMVAIYRQAFSEAEAWVEKGLRVYQAAGDVYGIANTLGIMGLAAFSQGQFPQAQSLLEESIEKHRQLKHVWAIANGLVILGGAVLNQGQTERAQEIFEESLSLSWDWLDDKTPMIRAIEGLGALALMTGQIERAVRLLGAVEMLEEKFGAVGGYPTFSDVRGSLLSTARMQLSQEAYDTARFRGKTMTVEQVLQYALAEDEAE